MAGVHSLAFLRLCWTALAMSLCLMSGPASADPAQIVKSGLPGLQQPYFQVRKTVQWPVAKNADWVAIDQHMVWVAGGGPNEVHRIDAGSNRDTLTVPLPGEACAGLLIAFDSLWVPLCGKTPSIVRIDPASGRIVATLPLGPADEGGIAASSDSIWFTRDARGTLVRLDPATNTVRQTIHIAEGSYNPIVDHGVVWITSVDHDLVTAVDARRGRVIGTTATGPHPRFLAAGAGSIWTLNQGDGSVTRIDARSRTARRSIALGIPGHGGDIAFDGRMIWASAIGFPLTAIDPARDEAVIQLIGPGGDALRFGHGSLWLTDYRGGSLSRIQPGDALMPGREIPALVGTWRLVSYADVPAKSAPVEAFGATPVGQFVFTADGHVAISLMRNPPDAGHATTDIDPDACIPAWYCSYFGTYAVDMAAGRWITHVVGGNIPSYLGTDQPRHFSIDGDRLTISETYTEAGREVRGTRVLVRDGK